MTKLMHRFSNVTRNTSLLRDERGLSTVEYVIILVLIAAAAVGTWQTLGTTITGKINASQQEINKVEVKASNASPGGG